MLLLSIFLSRPLSPPHCRIHFVCSLAPRVKDRSSDEKSEVGPRDTILIFTVQDLSRIACSRRSCSRRRLTAAPRVERGGARLPAPDTSDDEAGSLPRYRCQDGVRDGGDVPGWRERWQQDEQGAAVSGGRYCTPPSVLPQKAFGTIWVKTG